MAPAQVCLLLALSGCLEPGLDTAACWRHPQRAVQHAIAHNPGGSQIVLDQNAACLTPGLPQQYQHQIDRSHGSAGP